MHDIRQRFTLWDALIQTWVERTQKQAGPFYTTAHLEYKPLWKALKIPRRPGFGKFEEFCQQLGGKKDRWDFRDFWEEYLQHLKAKAEKKGLNFETILELDTAALKKMSLAIKGKADEILGKKKVAEARTDQTEPESIAKGYEDEAWHPQPEDEIKELEPQRILYQHGIRNQKRLIAEMSATLRALYAEHAIQHPDSTDVGMMYYLTQD
ncbi:MAG: hypothetical protein Q9212_002663 [Teloschistes hypoglaucus]